MRQIGYRSFVNQRPPPPPFPDYLRATIEMRGFRNPTEFAKHTGIHPSVVHRWLSGETRPAVPLLERAAPVLGAKLSTLVRIAYPEVDSGLPFEPSQQLHPLAAELERRLGPKSTLSADEQDLLARLIDSVLAPYRSRPTPKST